MPIPNFKPTQAKTGAVNSLQTAAIIDDDIALSKVVQYISGMSWIVQHYYNQQLSGSDIGKPLDTTIAPMNQQYVRIDGLELKVQTPLDSATIGVTTGSALTFVEGLTPLVYDYIITKDVTNRFALFRVTAVEIKHHNLNPIYLITYVLDNYVDIFLAGYSNIESKVVRNLQFNSDGIINGSSPLLENALFTSFKEAKKTEMMMTIYYFSSMVNRIEKTLPIPINNIEGSDPYLEEFLYTVANLTLESSAMIVNRTISPDYSCHEASIYGILLQRNIYYLKKSKDCILSNNLGLRELDYSEVHHPDRATVMDADTLPVMGSGMYLFSDNFFNETPVLSKIETVTMSYLRGENIDIDSVLRIAKSYQYWTKMEMYYYIPIVIFLLRVGIMKVRSII